MSPKAQPGKQIDNFKYDEARRTNIPTAEHEALMADEEKNPIQVAYKRRNRDLDPQLIWRGKDQQDWSDLVVPAPPLYIQEKVHPKALIEELRRQSRQRTEAGQHQQLNLFADFNGLPSTAAATEFYQHEAKWSNRMILGDSLQVMASLAEREGLQGKVQCIYLDPPYGIKFNSNFQWSTTSRDVKDGNRDHITREPEQVKAFRDTWRDGIHSYLTYLRDRLTVARDLLTESGSIFVQIGDENVHRIRALMDEVFGEDNLVAQIYFVTTSGRQDDTIDRLGNYVIWYAKNRSTIKYRQLFTPKLDAESESAGDLQSQGLRSTGSFEVRAFGQAFLPLYGNHWKASEEGVRRLLYAERIKLMRSVIRYRRFTSDFPVVSLGDVWTDTGGGAGQDKIYVVQTGLRVVQRCILMATDPGDLVLDPTCGSGTTAYVAEQWGRRWITIDTSRVALALARTRIMGARYLFYLLADSKEGQQKEAEITRTAPSTAPTYRNIRHGFVYERVPHITLKSIANNAEIDVIWEQYQTTLEPLRQHLNTRLGTTWEEWELPRDADPRWSEEVQGWHNQWWVARTARQKAIDASISAKVESEYLYDKPYEDKSTVRVSGPFTVESLSPHRTLVVDENDDLQHPGNFVEDGKGAYGDEGDFTTAILENLKTAGVQQAHRENRIIFTALVAWPERYICAEGRYWEGENDKERRAGIFIGPEFGTVARPDLVAAAREARDAEFDVLVACAFNYDAHSTEFEKLGSIPVLKARMNADLHMADTLKNTGSGNLFVIFGEPDIEIQAVAGQQVQVKLHGVDVFHPQSGNVESSGPDGIACWFIDTDYNEESFFVRHAYFLGANDPYKSLKMTLKAEIDEAAWESLHSDISRPFDKPRSGRIAVKVINHLGDEVMKVFNVD